MLSKWKTICFWIHWRFDSSLSNWGPELTVKIPWKSSSSFRFGERNLAPFQQDKMLCGCRVFHTKLTAHRSHWVPCGDSKNSKTYHLTIARWSGDVIRRTGMKNFNAVPHNRAQPYFRIQHGRGEVRSRRVYLNVHYHQYTRPNSKLPSSKHLISGHKWPCAGGKFIYRPAPDWLRRRRTTAIVQSESACKGDASLTGRSS